jgi:ADP-heptose:LPS heptosyltransferase
VVVKVCCLGDTLMATPTVASLRLRFPAARIDVAIGPWSRLALANNPDVGQLVDAENLLGGEIPRGDVFLRAAARLRRGAYDAAIVLERSLWLGLLPLVAGIPIRVGLDSGGRGFGHTRAVPVPPIRHEADLYLDCVAALGPGPLIRRMAFVPDRAAVGAADRALRLAGWSGQPFGVIHPGGGTNPGMQLPRKRWPTERFALIAERMVERGLRVVVVWGPDDRDVAADLLARAPAGVLGLPDLALPELAAVAARARLYLGNDTGPSHLAVAVGTPSVVVFGPSDERRFGPFGRREDGRPIGLAVANPTFDSDDLVAPFSNRSTADVTIDQVWAAIERQLA